MANRNWSNGGRKYAMHVSPVSIDCNFVVDSSAEDGISNLKGPTVSSVLMNSAAATPTATIAAGTIVVRLQDNYNQMLSPVKAMIRSPLSGADVKIDNSAMTAGVAYVITTLGDATAAKWLAIGVPAGIEPAVGVSFVALTNGGAGDTLTSRVQASATAGSGIATIEVLGNPDLSIAPDPADSEGVGSQIILQCRDYAGAIAAPADDSVISLIFELNNSSVRVSGE